MARGRGRPPQNSKKTCSKEVKKDSVPSPSRSKPGPLSKKPGRQLRSGKVYSIAAKKPPTSKAKPTTSSSEKDNVDRTKNSVKPTFTKNKAPKATAVPVPPKQAKPTSSSKKDNVYRIYRTKNSVKPTLTNNKVLKATAKAPPKKAKPTSSSKTDFLDTSVSDNNSEVETSIEKTTTNEVKDQKIAKKVTKKPTLTNNKVPKATAKAPPKKEKPTSSSKKDFLDTSVSDNNSEVKTSIEKTTTNEVKGDHEDEVDGIDCFINDYDDFSEDEDEEDILKNNNQLKKNVSKPKSSDSTPSSSVQTKNLTEKDFNASIDDNDNFNNLGTPKFASTPTRCITDQDEELQSSPKIIRPPVHDFSKLDLTKNTRNFKIIDSELPKVLTKTPPGPAWKLSEKTSEKMTLQLYAILGKTPPKTQKELNGTPRVPKTPGLYIDWEDKVDEIVHFGRRKLNETKFSEANTSFNSTTNKTFNSTNASDFTDSDEENENLDSCFSFEKYMIKPKPLDDILPDPIMVDNMIEKSRQIEDDDEEPMDCSELNKEIATELQQNRTKVNQKTKFLAWRGIQLNSYTE